MSGRRASSRYLRDRYGPTPFAASRVAWPSASALPWPPALCSVAQVSAYSPSMAQKGSHAYSSNDLLNALLVTFHVEECLDLAHGEVIAVAQRHELVKGAEKLVGILDNFVFVECLACVDDDLGEQVERVDVLENVGLAVGDEDNVELVKWLIDESNIVFLDNRVLRTAVGELGKGSK